ncbi:MAG TPA: hypothetical protein VMU50_03625 [Polyangia bacterium]|nr:hypothetical protein [Polyangia bacterium]
MFVTAITGRAMAEGATIEVVKEKDQSLLASFNHFDATCASGLNSALDVQWNSSLTRADGTTTLQSVAFLTLHYVNTCTGDDVLYSGFALNTNGSVSTDLGHGHFDAVVPVMTDPDPETGLFLSGTVNVSLDFTANGATATVRDHTHSKGGGVVTMNNFTVSSRPGVATGTANATLQGNNGNTFNVELIGGQPSLSASLGKDGFGSMTIVTKAH